MEEKNKAFFTINLMRWFANHHRPMPWKGEKNPYLIWLSEIILQQTRVEQGLPYFLKFKENYPTVTDLANAPEDEVMKLWQGLGYYSRARNLHFTAKYIAKNLNGEFPKSYGEILKLKGVGSYTAAAIASFAYDLPYAVVDGNVYRVLARYFGIDTAIDTTEGKKLFAKLAHELLDKKHSSDYNQAIMDFGATQCTPKNPSCSNCPLKEKCIGLLTQINDSLPVKTKKIKKKERFFHYLIINYDNYIYLQKRLEKDIWQNLYQFPMLETDKLLDFTVLKSSDFWKDNIGEKAIKPPVISKTYKQILTHQKIWATFYEVDISSVIAQNLVDARQYILVKKTDLDKFGFPKIIDLFLKEKTLSLKLF